MSCKSIILREKNLVPVILAEKSAPRTEEEKAKECLEVGGAARTPNHVHQVAPVKARAGAEAKARIAKGGYHAMPEIPNAKEEKEARREKEWREKIEKSPVCEFLVHKEKLTGIVAQCMHPESVTELCIPCCYEARKELRTFKLTLVKQFQRNKQLKRKLEEKCSEKKTPTTSKKKKK